MQTLNFPIVGIGASAGGLDAFRKLLDSLPTDTGMAFVLIQHLDPRHESALTSILKKSTSMKVLEVKNNIQVQPNHIYIIPPKMDLSLIEYELQVSPRSKISGQHMPIDSFFISLAKAHGEKSAGVILSGTGRDGTEGIRAIKGEGGFTFAQDPLSASYDQMPKNAIDTNCVDFVLSPENIADALSHITHFPLLSLPGNIEPKKESAQVNTFELKKVYKLLQKYHKVDFTNYKETTIKRRVFRRMVLRKIYSIESYIDLLEKDATEVKDLYNDLLINVTEFFRDKEAFEALESQVFPALLDKRENETIRIWVPGCSSGQEVYSIAISLLEILEKKSLSYHIQIFASDISEKSITSARAGFYPTNLLSNVSEVRLKRYFKKFDGGYEISKNVRDLCVFAIQNVTADPPFSKLDLISCRNLLIYLDKDLQKRVIPLFHYALKPKGFLLLGVSETIGTFKDLFHEVDRKNKIYSKLGVQHRSRINFAPYYVEATSRHNIIESETRTYSSSDIRRDVERYLVNHSVGVVINEKLEVIHTIGDIAPYLTLNQGTPNLNITKMARKFLSLEIRSLVQKVKEDFVPFTSELLQLKQDFGTKLFYIEVAPIGSNDLGGNNFLLLFKESFSPKHIELMKDVSLNVLEEDDEKDLKIENQKLKKSLSLIKNELLSLKDNLQTSIEIQEMNNEKLVTANEEILSSNEELQSTNEELETAKEELESTNEELTTVNQELQCRNEELSITNDDLINLLSSVRIPVVMLDQNFCIRRFTPSAEKILNVMPRDIGRSITDITLKIKLPNLKEVITNVIEMVTPKQFDVQDEKGHWFSFHIYPYITQEKRIDGVVLVLIDIDVLKTVRDLPRSIVETVRDPLIVMNNELKIIMANRSFYQTYRTSENETVGHCLFDLGNKQWDIPELRSLLTQILPKQNFMNDFNVESDFEHIGKRSMLLNARHIKLLNNETEKMILLSIQDITAQKNKEEELQCVSDQLVERNKELEQFAYITSHDLQEPLRMISLYMELLREQSADKLSSEELEYIKIALGGTKKMKELIRDLLDLSRTSKEELGGKLVDCSEVLKNTLVSLAASIKENDAKISFENLPKVAINPNLLGEVFLNLINNALKYRSEVTPEINVTALKQGKEWLFSVEDNGIGIKPENAQRIFQIFQRLHRDEEYPGTGIGLAVCGKIIKRYGGKIWVESELGKGSKFNFTIPIRSA